MFLHYLSIISKNEVLESIGAFAFAGLLQLTNMWVYMQPQKSRGKLSRGIILAGRWRQDVSKNKCEWTACVYVSPPQLHLWEHGVGEYRGVRFLWSPWTHRDVSITGRIMAAAKASNCESFILNEYVTKSVFFQDHNKVKTPATHPSRRIQEHRETPGSVSAQREEEEEEEEEEAAAGRNTFFFNLCLSNWLWVQNGSWVTGLLLKRAPTRPETWFFNELRSPGREIKCHTSSVKKANHHVSHVKSSHRKKIKGYSTGLKVTIYKGKYTTEILYGHYQNCYC